MKWKNQGKKPKDMPLSIFFIWNYIIHMMTLEHPDLTGIQNEHDLLNVHHIVTLWGNGLSHTNYRVCFPNLGF